VLIFSFSFSAEILDSINKIYTKEDDRFLGLSIKSCVRATKVDKKTDNLEKEARNNDKEKTDTVEKIDDDKKPDNNEKVDTKEKADDNKKADKDEKVDSKEKTDSDEKDEKTDRSEKLDNPGQVTPANETDELAKHFYNKIRELYQDGKLDLGPVL